MIGKTPPRRLPMQKPKVTRLHPVPSGDAPTPPAAEAVVQEVPAGDLAQAAPVDTARTAPTTAPAGSWLASLAASVKAGEAAESDDPDEEPVLLADEVAMPEAAPATVPVKDDVAPAVAPAEQPTNPVMTQLVDQLRQFDVGALAHEDPTIRGQAEDTWRKLLAYAVRVDRAFDGVAEAAKSILPGRLAKELAGVLNAADAHRTVAGERGHGASEGAAAHHGHGGGGGGISGAMDSLIRSPITMLQAGGGAMMDGLRKAHSVANDAIGRRRQSAYDVVARQVKSVAADIEADAQWLRAHGMEQVVSELKASGLQPSEAVAAMERGGKLERLGFQAKGVLSEPDVMDRMSQMNDKLKQLSEKGQRLVKAAQVADRDAEQVIEPAMKQVQDALEGMPEVGKDGKFKLLSEKVQEISDKIREILERIISKIVPGR